MKSDDARSWKSNRGYDDHAGMYYSYDSNVGRCNQVKIGDMVIVREDEHVAGWAIVESIEVTPNALKEISRCPNCRKTNHYRRTTMVPANKCNSCGTQFGDNEMFVTNETVTSFRAYYANTWTEAARPFDRKSLESFISTRDTFNAIRPVETSRLPELLDAISGGACDIGFELSQADLIIGGHTETIVRRRRGQREFRFQLMEKFGETCAMTGGQPPQVLEAAHLYSYASVGEHYADGGLLLRRDMHSLFDAHLLTVDPRNWRIKTSPRLEQFQTYCSLDGAELQLPTNLRPRRELIEVHFDTAMRLFSLH